MSFYGSEFIFDGVSCREFGLELYDKISSTSQDEKQFAPMEYADDRVPGRYTTINYGGYYKEPLSFKLVFGVEEYYHDAYDSFDRWDIERIAAWLTGHQEYKWLQIVQDDMGDVRYRCHISDLKVIDVFSKQYGFECTVTCDSPFAYMLPRTYTYEITGSADIEVYNPSSYNGYYLPKMKVSLSSGNDIIIVNASDNYREFSLRGIPTGCGTIDINHDTQLISCDAELNLYPYWNMKTLRLARGLNKLSITGDCTLELTCEFPANVGG